MTKPNSAGRPAPKSYSDKLLRTAQSAWSVSQIKAAIRFGELYQAMFGHVPHRFWQIIESNQLLLNEQNQPT